MADVQSSPPLGPININTASPDQLASAVPGIGPVLAERIVAHREEHGPFATVGDLVAVRGISPNLLEKIGPYLSVRDVPLPPEPEPDPMASNEDVVSPSVEDVESIDIADDAEPDDWPAQRQGDRVDRTGDLPEEAPGEPVGEAFALSMGDMMPGDDRVDVDTVAPEAPPVTSTPVFDAVAQAPEEVEVSTRPPVAPTVTPAPAPSRLGWRDLLLVLLGGLLGVVFTLVAAIIWSGTVDFAPRSQMDALSRDMGAMQADQDLARERIDSLSRRADEIDHQLSGLADDVVAAQAEVSEMQSTVGELSDDLQAVRGDLSRMALRMNAAEEDIIALDAALVDLQESFAAVEERVANFDAFFIALRDLLIEMQGMPMMPAEATEPVPAEIAPDDVTIGDDGGVDLEGREADPDVTPVPSGRSS
jgi:competence ComEA-like helix-hairpin-helix protein